MNGLYGIIVNFISAKNDSESLRYENQLLATALFPLLVLASAANLTVFFFVRLTSLSGALIDSGVFLLFAAALLLTSRSGAAERLISAVIIGIVAGLLCFIVLRFYLTVGPAVWTAACILITVSMTRRDRWMAAVICFVLILLGVYIWYRDFAVGMGTVYYVTQFIAFALLFAVSAANQYVNNERFKKLQYYLNESELVSQISSDFILVSPENLDEKVNAMIAKTGAYYEADRSVIFLTSRDQKRFIYSYEWNAPGIAPMLADPRMEFEISSRTEWVDQIKNRTVWIIPNVDEADEKTVFGKKSLQEMGVKSVISMPIIVKGNVNGILFYETFSRYRYWSEEHKKLLNILTHLLGDAFTKVEAEKEINRMAYFDMLTGLPNRFQFNQRLDRAILEAEGTGKRIAVLFIDLDSFKAVNDTTGHEGGDMLLRELASNLSRRLGDGGVVARFGGDEFIVMIEQADDLEEIKKKADNIMGAFNRPMYVGEHEFFITASAGIAIYPDDGRDSNTLKKNADLAMYEAKELGKNQAAFCTAGLKEDVERRVQLSNLLYRALENRELVLYYQPLVDIATKKIIGVEALLRWDHPELGMISPGVFIPLAEQTGLINPIGRWVLETACRQNKAWQDAGLAPLRLAVNLSVEQFHDPNLVEIVGETLNDTGLEAQYLELEITESIAIRETGYICQILQKLKTLGVLIAIDDFGTKYSSLARIKQLPIDRIKMAMEFVHGISVSEKDEAIAKVIINLASNLGLKVIAEGVETESQFEFLKSRVCDEVQGYYFYRPMPAADLERLLRKIADEAQGA